MDVINLLYKIRRSDALWRNILTENQKMMLKYQKVQIVNSGSSSVSSQSSEAQNEKASEENETTIYCEPSSHADIPFYEIIEKALVDGINLEPKNKIPSKIAID